MKRLGKKKVPGVYYFQDFFVYYTMTIIVDIPSNIYTVSVPVDNPDTEQLMCAIEMAVRQADFPEVEMEEYILDWAAEIKIKRDGKS